MKIMIDLGRDTLSVLLAIANRLSAMDCVSRSSFSKDRWTSDSGPEIAIKPFFAKRTQNSRVFISFLEKNEPKTNPNLGFPKHKNLRLSAKIPCPP
jgi:hypothetical protein